MAHSSTPYSRLVLMGFDSSAVNHALELSEERFEDALRLLSSGEPLPPVPPTRYEIFVAELNSIPEVSEVALLENPSRLGFTLTIGNLRTRMFFMNPPVYIETHTGESVWNEFKLPLLFTVPDSLVFNSFYIDRNLMIGLEEAASPEWFDVMQQSCPAYGFHLLLTLAEVKVLIEQFSFTMPGIPTKITIKPSTDHYPCPYKFFPEKIHIYSPHYRDVLRKLNVAMKLMTCRRKSYLSLSFRSGVYQRVFPEMSTDNLIAPTEVFMDMNRRDSAVGDGLWNFRLEKLCEVIQFASVGGLKGMISSLINEHTQLLPSPGGSVSLCIGVAGGNAAQFFPSEIRYVLDQPDRQHLVILVDPYIDRQPDGPFRSWSFQNVRFVAFAAAYFSSCNEKLFEFFSTLKHMGVISFNVFTYVFYDAFTILCEQCREFGLPLNLVREQALSVEPFLDLSDKIPDGILFTGYGPAFGYSEFSYESVADVLSDC